MQRVTLIHSVYLSHKNGANTVIRLLLANKKRFTENGIDIYSLAPNENVYSPEKGGMYAKIRKEVSTLTKKILINLAQYQEWAIKKVIYLRDQRSGEMMANKYLSQNPSEEEVVFFHTLFTCYYYLKNRVKRQHVVLVLHTNGEPFKMQRIYYNKLESSAYYKEMLEIERFVLEQVDRIVFVAQKPREVFLQCHPYVNQQKVFCVYNGVENSEVVEKSIKKENETIEICCVASITPRKGQHYIVEALEKMEKKPNVHFTFVGGGTDRVVLEERVKRDGLQEFFTFAGITNDVDSYLKRSDVYILPSEDEGLPMAILEAMRASLPIVSTPVGGIPEMLEDGYNGIMIEPNVASVKHFLENLQVFDWATMGKNARAMFEKKFTVDKMVDEYSKVLCFK